MFYQMQNKKKTPTDTLWNVYCYEKFHVLSHTLFTLFGHWQLL